MNKISIFLILKTDETSLRLKFSKLIKFQVWFLDKTADLRNSTAGKHIGIIRIKHILEKQQYLPYFLSEMFSRVPLGIWHAIFAWRVT